MRSAILKAVAALAVVALATPVLATRELKQTITDADIYNFALNLEYLEANFYHCGAYGTPITPLFNGGPAPIGCVQGQYDDATHNLFVEFAREEMSHVQGIQAALGSAAVAQPLINLTALSAAANAAAGTTLSPPFSYASNYITGLLSAFVFEDVGVTAYNGAAPLISDKTLLADAVGIGLIEGYHAGVIRKTVFDIGSTATGYGLTVAQVADAITVARGKLSAAAGNGNTAEQGLTTTGSDGVVLETIIPSGAYNIAFSRTPAEVLAIVYLGSATTPGGFFPNGLNGSIK